MKRLTKFITCILCFVYGVVGCQEFSIDVMVNIPPPYPTRISKLPEFKDQIQAVFTNIGSEEVEFKISGSIENLTQGFEIRTNAQTQLECFSLGPGEQLTIDDIDFQATFDVDQLVYQGITQTELIIGQDLPEGMYRFCFQALGCANPIQELSSAMSGCAMFDVTYADPPVNISLCNEEISPSTDAQVSLSWMWLPPGGFMDMVTYKVVIVPFDPELQQATEAIEAATEPMFFSQETEENFLVLQIPDDLDLEENQSYAIQIIVEDPSEELTFRNDGRSEVCTFSTGRARRVRRLPIWSKFIIQSLVMSFHLIPCH